MLIRRNGSHHGDLLIRARFGTCLCFITFFVSFSVAQVVDEKAMHAQVDGFFGLLSHSTALSKPFHYQFERKGERINLTVTNVKDKRLPDFEARTVIGDAVNEARCHVNMATSLAGAVPNELAEIMGAVTKWLMATEIRTYFATASIRQTVADKWLVMLVRNSRIPDDELFLEVTKIGAKFSVRSLW